MSNLSRRTCLDGVTDDRVTHAGLWLDRYLPGQDTRGDSSDTSEKKQQLKAEHLAHTASIGNLAAASLEYAAFFERWCISIAEAGATLCKATANGRMVVGLGNESVGETSISLHQIYGVPYIPGSALKGLAAHFAHQRLGGAWAQGEKFHRELFGDADLSGCVTFYDALHEPGSGHQKQTLWPDVMTVHHPDYYQGQNPPADWDSPTIIPFLSATGSFVIGLAGEQDWVNTAHEILKHALKHMGIGAKTSSGYGRMQLDTQVFSPPSFEEIARKHRLLSPPMNGDANTPTDADVPAHRDGQATGVRGAVVAREYASDWLIALEDGRHASCRLDRDIAVGQYVWIELLHSYNSQGTQRALLLSVG